MRYNIPPEVWNEHHEKLVNRVFLRGGTLILVGDTWARGRSVR